MLAAAWRFIVYNKCGEQLDFSGNSANESAEVIFKRKHFDSSNGVSEDKSGDPTTHSADTDLADGATEALTSVTGETELQMDGVFTVETDNASADGDVILGIERSPDGGTTWPSAATDWDPDTDMAPVAVITLGGAETVSTDFKVD